MSYYSIIFNTPINQDWIEDYITPANNSVARHGGKILARTASHQLLEGERTFAYRTIIEWPTKEAALAFMNDPEYVPHLKARLNGSESEHLLIEGTDDLAS